VHRTAGALGLEYNKLKRARGEPAAVAASGDGRRRAAGTMKFLDLTPALPLAGATCRVRLAGPAGQHLELEMSPDAAKEVVLELCREGWGTRP
jgi:hypothetical protein